MCSLGAAGALAGLFGEGHGFAAGNFLDVGHFAEAESAPVVVDRHLPYGFVAELAKSFPARIAVEVAAITFAAAFGVAAPEEGIALEYSVQTRHPQVDFGLGGHKQQGESRHSTTLGADEWRIGRKPVLEAFQLGRQLRQPHRRSRLIVEFFEE